MSEPLRIALVAEGVTDYEVLDAVVAAMLGDRSYVLDLLQPEESVAFIGGGDAGAFGGGWKGVCKWCRQAAARGGGRLGGDPLFWRHDLLLLHLDADVAGEKPAPSRGGQVPPGLDGLPCERPCPPPRASTDPLRQILLSWCGETGTPPKTVLCTPSKSTEAWVMAIFFPTDSEMLRLGWECHPKPEIRLGQQPKALRFAKKQSDYQRRKPKMRAEWGRLVDGMKLTEARRFQCDFLLALEGLP